MKHFLILCAFVGLGISNSYGQTAAVATVADTTKNWKFGGYTSLQVNQVALLNWAAGGSNSVSGTALLGGFANYHKGVWSWSNSIDLGYGIIYSDQYGLQKKRG